jgi:hypothetical protein
MMYRGRYYLIIFLEKRKLRLFVPSVALLMIKLFKIQKLADLYFNAGLLKTKSALWRTFYGLFFSIIEKENFEFSKGLQLFL